MADAGSGGSGVVGSLAAPQATLAAGDGRQIDAFAVQQVLQEHRIQSLEAWGQYALLGLSDGNLLLASQHRTASGASAGTSAADAAHSTSASRPPQQPGAAQQQQVQQQEEEIEEGQEQGEADTSWAVVQSLRGFGPGPVRQLVVARERSMLLCLADDGVNAYALPGLRLKGQAARTRGGAAFAWHGGTDTLAVAVKRKVLIFKYDGLEFVEQREVGLHDAPACLALVGATLYAGLAKREYVAVDVATGGVTPLFATKGPAPCLAAVSPTEVLLARDSGAVLYGPDGRPSRRGGGGGKDAPGQYPSGALPWSAPPVGLAASGPYAVAIVEGAAEARLLEPLDSAADLWQQLPAPMAAGATSCAVAPSAADDGSLLVANRETGAVLRLKPISFVRQAEQLLGMGQHEEALAMAALAPPQHAQQRRFLEDRIHLAFGQQLFRQGQYEDAMLHFGMSALAGPLELLRLFPSLAPPQLLAAAAAETEAAGGAAVEAAYVGLAAASVAAAGDAAAEAATGVAEPQGEVFVVAVQQLMPYLLSHRSRLAAAAASPVPKPASEPQAAQHGERGQQQHTPQRAVDVHGVAGDAGPGQSPSTHAAQVQRRLEGSATAALVDTALLLALLALPDSGALLRFVHRPNCVDLAAGEAALRGAGRYSELVALYETKGRHAAALELLRALSQSPEQLPAPAQGASAELRGLPGVWAAVKYVCHLAEQERDLGLLSTHAKWMLAADPDAGLEMFANMRPPLAPSAALPMLTSYAPQLAGAYLESALASGAAEPAQYEQELAKIYLERIVGSSGTGSGAGAASAAAAGVSPAAPTALPEYGKLLQLILGSRHLDYEALLRVAPTHRLQELRAALLERLGRHTEALRIFVHRLRALPLAEAYCDRVYQRRQAVAREQRHAELAAGLRRQRQQREAAAAAASGALPGTGALSSFGVPPIVSSAGSKKGGSARSLGRQFGEAAAAAAPLTSMPAVKLQPAFSGGSSSEDGADIYLLLVQVLLEEEDGAGGYHPVQRAPDHAVWGEVARLLSRKRDAIQPLHALSLLPGEVPLTSALPFLEGALWGAGERRRAASVARSLRRSEHVGLLGQLADARQRSVALTPERNCSICYKRVGTAALVAFPSGLLAHYSCWRRTSGPQQQQGGTHGAAPLPVNGGSGREWR